MATELPIFLPAALWAGLADQATSALSMLRQALPTPAEPLLDSMLGCTTPIINWYRSTRPLTTAEVYMIALPPLLYWVYSSLLYLLSYLKVTSVELHRIPTDQKMRPANRVTVQHVIKTVAVQHVVQVLAAYGLAIADGGAFDEMEVWWLCGLKVVIACCLLDTYQYWMHRWMHQNRWLYRHFHSVHHELTVLYAFGALYNHPLEGFFMDTLGSGLASLLLQMHPWTSTLFFSIATLKTVDDHCGYTLPWDPLQRLFRNNAAYHDLHHWGKGRMFNFSQPFFTYWDVWMGTDYEYFLRAEAKRLKLSGPFVLPNERLEKAIGPISQGVSVKNALLMGDAAKAALQ